jgi:hypothetical protein
MTQPYKLTIKNEFTYSLNIHGEYSEIVYNTIQKLIKTAHIDYNTNNIIFSAEYAIPFKTYLLEQKDKRLSYSQCIKLIDDLSKQIFYMKKLGYSFYGFNIDDILTIDNTFILCSSKHLLPLENDDIIIMYPIFKPYFSNPEILKLRVLPTKINYKCIYYSLGSLIVFSLLNTYLLVANELKTSEEIDIIIQPLYNTKIYWFIKRCLEQDINERRLLLI